jgi:hypothetical protein
MHNCSHYSARSLRQQQYKQYNVAHMHNCSHYFVKSPYQQQYKCCIAVLPVFQA